MFDPCPTCREQRITGILVFALTGVSIFLAPVLKVRSALGESMCLCPEPPFVVLMVCAIGCFPCSLSRCPCCTASSSTWAWPPSVGSRYAADVLYQMGGSSWVMGPAGSADLTLPFSPHLRRRLSLTFCSLTGSVLGQN